MTRLVLVTSRETGVRAFEGILASSAYLSGDIEVPLIVGLSRALAKENSGFDSPWRLARDCGARFEVTADGRLGSLAGEIKAAEPDYLLVIGWSRLIPADVLNIPAIGAIGMHPSPLPVGRGRAPVPWAILRGLKETALSVFFLDEGADTGPLIAQYPVVIRERETSASLWSRLAALHFRAGMTLGRAMGNGPLLSRPQAGTPEVWPKRTPADGEILPSMTRWQVDALVRAQLGPYPRAFTAEGPVRAAWFDAAPGSFPFRCADGTIHLTRDAQ